MHYYDRYNGKMTADLPVHMDLGRFAVMENGEIRDLTNIDVVKLGDYVIRESLFEETNQNIHDLLHTIAISYESAKNEVSPIIQKFNIEIKDFERLINEQKTHLRAIVANPHSLLDKNTIKVNIGRAKRISTRSYQYLAHHSEDWEKMSIISPKPRKILNEELTVEYAVYENILFKAFLHEAVKYLNKRIKETSDISKFFISIFGAKFICPNCRYEYEYTKETETLPSCCPHCSQEVEWIDGITTIWVDKIDRRSALVGKAIKTDNSKVSGTTNRALAALKSELVKMEHAPFFEEFPKRITDSVVYHDTNVLNSHKHYKYLKILWLELKKIKETTEDRDPIIIHQSIMDNMRTYVETLFVYSLRQMNYSISERKGELTAIHKSLPPIKVQKDNYGVLHLSTSNSELRIISIGGIYNQSTMRDLPSHTICFCFGDYQMTMDNVEGLYFVNPIDTNSIEYSGQVVRTLILQEYVAIINQKVSFKQSLRDFVSAVCCEDLSFDLKSYTFCFPENLPNEVDIENSLNNLKNQISFKQRNRRDQDSLMNDMCELIKDINTTSSTIKTSLVCPKCANRYRQRSIKYLVCDCGFVCDISSEEPKFFHQQKDQQYKNITTKGWGMDYV